jgi:ubiquinone/menaquinone biosynthesis C-methylase UbiE
VKQPNKSSSKVSPRRENVLDKNEVRKEWDNSAKAWADFVRTGKDHDREDLNNPATFELIGNIKGLAVLDLACGEGYNTRILARKGAKVTGIDFSDKQIELARQEERRENLGIEYMVMDAADLTILPDSSFDLVTCFMALQDVENYRKAVSETSRVLKLNGRFVFSIPHPCFEKIALDGKRINAADAYFEEMMFPIHWNMERLSTPFRTFSFHRTLTDYFDILNKSRLYVSKLIEPRFAEEAYEKHHAQHSHVQKAFTKPSSILIEAVKIIMK